MFIDNLKSIVVVAFVLLLTCFMPSAFAGDVVPTDKDVEFAGQFYITFRNIVDYNKDLNNSISIQDDYEKTIGIVDDVMNRRLQYAELTLDKLNVLKPTEVFDPCYNAVVKAVKEDMVYVKEIIQMCEKKKPLEEIDDKENILQETEKAYMGAKEAFVVIVKSWQPEYVRQVEDIYDNAKNEDIAE